VTDDDLILAAYQRQVIHVPGCGFLIDGEVPPDDIMLALARLHEERLLCRPYSRHPQEQAYLRPTVAGLSRIGVSHR
jgi:hypothetical protein